MFFVPICTTVDVVRVSLPLHPNPPVCRDGQVGWIILVDAVLICNKLLEQVDWNNWKRGINILQKGAQDGILSLFYLIFENINPIFHREVGGGLLNPHTWE